MIGEKMNKNGDGTGCALIWESRIFRGSRNGLRPRPDVPDIPGGNAERDRNKLKNIEQWEKRYILIRCRERLR